MWTHNQTCQNELYHYGTPGMKWGVRKAQYKERIALRRAAGAIGEKRKNDFLKVADQHRKVASTLTKQINQQKKKVKEPAIFKKYEESIIKTLNRIGKVKVINIYKDDEK